MEKQSLLQRLRKTRSSGKTLIIEQWSQIRDSIQAGFSKKHIFEELVKDGLTISYTQFTRFTKELMDQELTHQKSGQQDAIPVMPKMKASLKKSEPSKKVPAKQADGSEKNRGEKSGDRFHFDPKPNEKDLF